MRMLLTALCLMAIGRPAFGQASCRVEGAWELVSGNADGHPYPATLRQMKVITKGHFAFVGEEERGVIPMVTAAGTLRALRTTFSGGGTYTLGGNEYTEQFEYFSDPAYFGMSISVPFTCRTDGDRFFLTGSFSMFQDGRKVREVRLEEEWRRIEE